MLEVENLLNEANLGITNVRKSKEYLYKAEQLAREAKNELNTALKECFPFNIYLPNVEITHKSHHFDPVISGNKFTVIYKQNGNFSTNALEVNVSIELPNLTELIIEVPFEGQIILIKREVADVRRI